MVQSNSLTILLNSCGINNSLTLKESCIMQTDTKVCSKVVTKIVSKNLKRLRGSSSGITWNFTLVKGNNIQMSGF